MKYHVMLHEGSQMVEADAFTVEDYMGHLNFTKDGANIASFAPTHWRGVVKVSNTNAVVGK